MIHHGPGLDGTILAEVHRQYTIFCEGCGAQDIEWVDNLREAERIFRICGWVKRGGRWFCHRHLATKRSRSVANEKSPAATGPSESENAE